MPARALENVERPAGARTNADLWGGDAIAEMLRRCDIEYIALVPGSSYRGLHDSLINYLGNAQPQMLVCLHEEHSVAIAHGYSKVNGRAMAAAVHSNVGLMHATMAIFNAYCDRAPVLVLGANGPMDASRRRPWIDWIHTSRDLGALVRGYVKWDEQPASPRAGMEATVRAWQLANTHPKAPTYVCYDVSDLEQKLEPDFPLLDVTNFALPSDPVPDVADVAKAVEFLRGAQRPLIMVGRSSRKGEDWERRVRLAELLGAAVITDAKTPASFPTEHPLHVGEAGMFTSAPEKAAIFAADVILALDCVDLGGALFASFGHDLADRVVISAGVDDGLANGWSYDHCMLPPVTLKLASTPDNAVAMLLAQCEGMAPRSPWRTVPATMPPAPAADGTLDLRGLARAVGAARRGRNVTLVRLPIGWPNNETPFSDPLDYLGADGGAGVGSGPGMAVGSALALRGSGRLPVAILGDGDFIMGGSAIWTAAHYRIPLLIIVANNRSYFNDEIHQETMARVRGRHVENRWIGQRLDDPPVDLDHMAKSFGAVTERSSGRRPGSAPCRPGGGSRRGGSGCDLCARCSGHARLFHGDDRFCAKGEPVISAGHRRTRQFSRHHSRHRRPLNRSSAGRGYTYCSSPQLSAASPKKVAFRPWREERGCDPWPVSRYGRQRSVRRRRPG